MTGPTAPTAPRAAFGHLTAWTGVSLAALLAMAGSDRAPWHEPKEPS